MKVNFLLEYIWLDGSYPQQIRSKTKFIEREITDVFSSIDRENLITKESFFKAWKEDPSILPIWNFDGSSTGQAETSKSELLLNPVNIFRDPTRNNGFIVMCDVMNIDGTPHVTNRRYNMMETLNKYDDGLMVGLEQEFFIFDSNTRNPLGWPANNTHIEYMTTPDPQGPYYCAVGSKNISGRAFIEEHARLCEGAELKLSGINAEVALGQWEYQIGPVYAAEGADQLWVSRFLLERLSENYNYYIILDPKPFKGNEWNGSGLHINLSSKQMRKDMKNKKKLAMEACEKLGKNIEKHIKVYGINNEHRLTGANETCSISEYRYGIGDRTASVRIPSSINDNTTPGYIEDRRPASNTDPYEAINVIVETILGSDCTEYQEYTAQQLDMINIY